MAILYLYTEAMGYTMATIKTLVESGFEVHLVYWDHKKLTPYQIPDYKDVRKYERSKYTTESLIELSEKIYPDITVVSGWADKGYLSVACRLRKQGRAVVTGLDRQWHGSLKQFLAAGLGMASFFSRYFSHAWVAGVYQYEYARKLGFYKKNIIFDLYSADLPLFQKVYQELSTKKKFTYPHRFLFVGRLEVIKGIDTLLAAWKALGEAKKNWELHLIGNGSLKTSLAETSGIVVKDFMQPEQLVKEIADAGCFILPSRCEPWGVVVHEFAAAGLPLIISDVVGASSVFLIPGMNGYSFKANDPDSLATMMAKIIGQSDQGLLAMAKASHELSDRITPATSANNLLSIISES